jgi:uncharacterized membrane protein
MLFRTFASVALLALAAGPAGAQETRAFRAESDKVFLFNEGIHVAIGGDSANDEVIQSVKGALTLSDVQVNALKTLLSMRAQNSEQVFQSMAESQRKLEDLLAQPSPNATEVGAAMLAVRGMESQMKAADDKFRSDFRAMLSADQRAALDKLSASSSSINALEAAGILDGGAGVIHPFTVHGPEAPLGAAVTGHAIRIERR